MDKFIDSRFERVEKALANLIDSVSKYHPYAAQAVDLQAADKELGKGLEEVQIHQNNHLRLQQLRAATASLDTQVRETLSSLATTRKDVVTTQITIFQDGPNYPIKYDELLNYARRISKTTLPPAGVTNGILINGEAPDLNASMNGTQTQPGSTAQTPSQTQTPDATNGSQLPSELPTQNTMASTSTSIPDGLRNAMDPHYGTSFIPWPNEFQIRSGAMAVFQDLLEKGIDPKGYDPVILAEQKRKAEEERREQEEKEKERQRLKLEAQQRDWDEKMRRGREEAQEALRRGSVAIGGGAPEPANKKQFMFTSLDDLDDDDED